jgi:hypothetical protein
MTEKARRVDEPTKPIKQAKETMDLSPLEPARWQTDIVGCIDNRYHCAREQINEP